MVVSQEHQHWRSYWQIAYAVTYLEKAKDLFDKGLVGTDDFKSIATYLSPTGSDDPVNFAENYTKAVRYLTEDASGVQNFLNDLQFKGYAALETMSDGTQQWTYDIKDLEQAASGRDRSEAHSQDRSGNT